jgi:hypothetical protein
MTRSSVTPTIRTGAVNYSTNCSLASHRPIAKRCRRLAIPETRPRCRASSFAARAVGGVAMSGN